jgi:single-strand DNA-binding protein
VVVQGRLRQRSFETKEGEKRTVMELEVDEIGPSLRYATAKVTKATRTPASTGASTGGAAAADAWADGSPMPDEPPF